MPNSRLLDCRFFSLVRRAMPGRWLLAAMMIAALLLPCINSPSSARAEFTPLNPGVRNDPAHLNFSPVCNAQLTGRIDPGDYELLKPKVDMFMADPRVAPIVSAIRAQMEAFSTNPFNTDLKLIDRQFYALCLSSKGGDLKEARRLAALFDGWIMVVGLDRQGNAQECASACAVLFMQGKRRDGIFTSNEYKRYPGRYLHYKSRLGFHAPRLEFPTGTQKVSVAEAEQAYVAALTSVQELLQDAPSDYFHEDNKRRGEDFPDDLILRLLTTPPAMMHWVETMQEAVQWGIEVYGVAPPPALTDRHLMLACANVAYKRCNQLRTLDRCADEFAVKSTELNFARIGAFKLPQSGAAGTRAAEIDKIKAMTATWAPRLVPIMQPTGNANGVSIEGVLFEHKSPQFALHITQHMHKKSPFVINIAGVSISSVYFITLYQGFFILNTTFYHYHHTVVAPFTGCLPAK